MASGVTCDDSVIKEFKILAKKNSIYRYCVFKLSANFKNIVFEVAGDRCETFEDMKARIPKDDARYIAFDFEYETTEGGKRSKVAFILWCDDCLKMKTKMLYTSSKAEIVKKLQGGFAGKPMEIHCLEELNEKDIIDQISNFREK